jgi:hypothetical protein
VPHSPSKRPCLSGPSRTGRLVAFALLLASWGGPGAAAALADDAAEEGGGGRLFPPRLTTGPVTYLPKIYYSSLTSVALGGQIVYAFDNLALTLPVPDSDLRVTGRVTFKGQIKAEAEANIRWSEGRWFTKARLAYTDLPVRYYGIGPDTPQANEEVYRPRDLLAYLEVTRSVWDGLRLGLRVEGEHLEILERRTGGILDTSDQVETTGRRAVGAGMVAEWDTRDRRFSPTSGRYWQAFSLVFESYTGSLIDFNNYAVDLRNYFPTGTDQVLATQLVLFATEGDAPFWRAAELGGHAHSRGYRTGRYLDKVLLAGQAEYRRRVAGRVGVAAFAGLANVGSSLGRMTLSTVRPTVGAGLELRSASREGVTARADVAVGEQLVRVYLFLDEAF